MASIAAEIESLQSTLAAIDTTFVPPITVETLPNRYLTVQPLEDTSATDFSFVAYNRFFVQVSAWSTRQKDADELVEAAFAPMEAAGYERLSTSWRGFDGERYGAATRYVKTR